MCRLRGPALCRRPGIRDQTARAVRIGDPMQAEELQVAQDSGQKVVEVMRDAGCYLADRLQALRLPEIPGGTFLGSDICDSRPTADELSLRPELASRGQASVEDAPVTRDEPVIDTPHGTAAR